MRFRKLARAELARYGVKMRRARVVAARRLQHYDSANSARQADRTRQAFEVRLATAKKLRARKLLLATGVRDILPKIPGAKQFYGAGLHHCPYCDAWNYRGKRLIALGKGMKAVRLAFGLRVWSRAVTACTNGTDLSRASQARLIRAGITWKRERPIALEGSHHRLNAVRFETGERLSCDAIFFNTEQVQHSDLPNALGCKFDSKGGVRIDGRGRTGVQGLFLAGDAQRDVQFVVNAIADGARAALAINSELQAEDLGQ
jgi:thioredoxin reductase